LDLEVFQVAIPKQYANALANGILVESRDFGRGADVATCTLQFDQDGRRLQVQSLSSIPGLTADEVDKYAVGVSIGGLNVRVLDPIALCQAKAANVAQFPDRAEKDIRHLRMAIVCSSEYIADVFADRGWRGASSVLERVLNVGTSKNGNLTKEGYRVDWAQAVPWKKLEDFAKNDQSLRNFLNERAARWRERVIVDDPKS
jgi:hypothetical protein